MNERAPNNGRNEIEERRTFVEWQRRTFVEWLFEQMKNPGAGVVVPDYSDDDFRESENPADGCDAAPDHERPK
jgi:hypothetical protein